MEKPSLELLRVGGTLGRTLRWKYASDRYVPLRLGIEGRRSPAAYIHLRRPQEQVSLVEIAVAPRTNEVHRIHLIGPASRTPWPKLAVTQTDVGLPVLSADLQEQQRVEARCEWAVSARPREILIFWDTMNECESLEACGVGFLHRERILRGVWLHELSPEFYDAFVESTGEHD